MKLSNYSLNYSNHSLDIFGFLERCRQLGVEGASIHIRNLQTTEIEYLKKIRRSYLDQGLAISMFTVTTDFSTTERIDSELVKTEQALHIAQFLGAPLLRVFAGSPRIESERDAAFRSASDGIRQVCDIASKIGIPVGLQNHNHGALVRTGSDVLRMNEMVSHDNFTFILDTGQFAGSSSISNSLPSDLSQENYLESIRLTAPLARYVRTKFYKPGNRGEEPLVPYDAIFDILRSVHYSGFLDVVYEPRPHICASGEAIETAIPRILSFLRSHISLANPSILTAHEPVPRERKGYADLNHTPLFDKPETQTLHSVSFLEGPAVSRRGDVYFTNIPASQILKWDTGANEVHVFREPSNAANGLAFNHEGQLLACEGGGRVTQTNLKTGAMRVLSDHYNQFPLGAPNDLALDSRGRIFFTSRLANQNPALGNVNAVYRIDPDGRTDRVLSWPDIDMPNGIVTSPDDSRLYLIDADVKKNHARRIRCYDLHEDGTVSHERLLYDFYPGRSGDGMCIDEEGNLYVAAGLHNRRGTSETLDTKPGIHVISPEGKLIAFLSTPEDTITNCTFGGPDLKTLYITCGKLLLHVRTSIPGKASYRPQH